MSLRLKTILGVALIEAILLTILITTVLDYMRNSSQKSLINYAQTTTTLSTTTTKEAMLSYDLASLESFVTEILTNQDILYVKLIDSNNTLLASGGDKELLERPFVADTTLESIDDKVYDTYAEIREADTIYGRIELGISTHSITDTIDETSKLSAIIAAAEMGLVALFSFILGTYLTRQLKGLRLAAKNIREGNLDHQIEVKGNDEIADVANSFNNMVDRLKATDKLRANYQEKLESLNKELEDRVKQRTQQLAKKNDELSSAYETLKEAQAQLLQSEKMASIGQLAAGVAHEINNPIGFVSSNLHSLAGYVNTYKELIDCYEELDESKIDPDQKDIIEKIKQKYNEGDISFVNEDIDELLQDSIDGIHRVSEIVRGLKNFSHVDQDEAQEADINDCLETTLKVINNEIKYKCVVEKDLQDIPRIYCHPGKLNQVFMNLIVNASHAIEEKGIIKIETKHINDTIHITISDNGSGIAEENIPKLFDPFFTTKPMGSGTGLGLSISHGIIEKHNGEIQVSSVVGEGTTFNIILPIQHSSALNESTSKP